MEAINQTIMYFHKGGLVMWPLLFCSLMVISISIERFLFYKGVDSGQKFTNSYCALLRDNRKEDALDLAKEASGQGSVPTLPGRKHFIIMCCEIRRNVLK